MRGVRYGSKVMTRNTFHGDPRQSLWLWRAQAEISGREASLIAPSGSENERVSCCCRKKLSGSKSKKRAWCFTWRARELAQYSSR